MIYLANDVSTVYMHIIETLQNVAERSVTTGYSKKYKVSWSQTLQEAVKERKKTRKEESGLLYKMQTLEIHGDTYK